MGASSGGFSALRFIASALPAELDASVLVTLHLASDFPSELDRLLSGAGPLPAQFATDGEALLKGRIYVAPPERHLLLCGERLTLGAGPRENLARPAIDPMLRSVGVCCGFRAIGVILTGALDDGAAGLAAMKLCGGVTVVQSPEDAAYPEMPAAALERSEPDHVVALDAIPSLLATLVKTPGGKPQPASQRLRAEVEIARGKRANIAEMDRIGRCSPIVCPDCGGVLWETDENGGLRYRCHTGHAYTAGILKLALDDNVRRALDVALRALEERLALVRRLRRMAAESHHRHSVDL
ncbi:MAG: chemotaxis protein CheB [Methylocystis sp.]|uniref:chemotaxis protein CheB n=1 Tax=Methylocystis sp. TaxID=1911079 RepID=UPI003DA2C785